MPIYLGTNKIKDLLLGASKIKEVWLGTSKIYSSEIPFPEGYTRYDYLKALSTASSRLVLEDVLLNVYSKTVMEMMVVSGTANGTKNVWGHSNVAGQRVWYNHADSNFLIATGKTISAAKDVIHELTIIKDTANSKLTLTIGQTSVETSSTANANTIKFGTNYSSAVAGFTKYYSAKIYDGNNKLIRNLVPAKRDSDSRSGFVNLAYDVNDETTGKLFYETEQENAMYAENNG